MNNEFIIGKAVWKGVRTLLYVIGYAGATQLPELPALPDLLNDAEFWVAVGTVVVEIGRNFRKWRKANPRAPFWFYRWLPVFLLVPALTLGGCATFQSGVRTEFSETIVDENGAPVRTVYKAVSRGDVETAAHDFSYRYGGEENVIAVGQNAEGVTSPTAQLLVEVFHGLIPSLPDILRILAGSGLVAPATGSVAGPVAGQFTPSLGEALELRGMHGFRP